MGETCSKGTTKHTNIIASTAESPEKACCQQQQQQQQQQLQRIDPQNTNIAHKNNNTARHKENTNELFNKKIQ